MATATKKYLERVKKDISLMKVAIELITPRMAEKYLKKNTKNRKASREIVRKWRETLEAEEWSLNGETVKFDKRGNLIDGQHRLMAISEGEIPGPMIVVRGLPEESFTTIDIGRKRTNIDILSSNGVESASFVTGAIVWIERLITDGGLVNASLKKINTNNVMDYYLKHKKIEKFIPLAKNYTKKRYLNATSMSALIYLFDKKDSRLCLQFRNGLENGFQKGSLWDRMDTKLKRIALTEKGTPFWEMRRKVLVIVKCWNAYRNNEDKTYRDIEFRYESEEVPNII